jgi:Flp pilus assembly protein TadG
MFENFSRLALPTTVWRDSRGAVAPIFGLTILSLAFVTGLAIDSARGYRATADVGQALDAAALATAKVLRLEKADDARLHEVADQYFAVNFLSNYIQEASYKNLKVVVDRERNSVTLTVDVELPTTVGVLMNVEKFDIVGKSTAIYDAKDVELSMMLDVSGSMAGSKIADLRAASSDLVDILMAANDSGAEHRISIAPFSNSVNAGKYSSDVSDEAQSKSGKGKGTPCVTERPGSNAFNDKGPKNGKFGKKAATCPASSIFALSDDKDKLLDHIETLTVGSGTAGHLGIAWAWYLLSPEWKDVWGGDSEPKDYNDPETQKAVIIMTDGRFNTFYEPGNGDSEAQARRLCDNMKAQSVTVYTVGFQAPSDALPILQYCASSPSHFFDAKDGSQLRSTFQTIAKRLSSLRLDS